MKVTITHRRADNTVEKIEGLNGEPLRRYKAIDQSHVSIDDLTDDDLAAMAAQMLNKEYYEGLSQGIAIDSETGEPVVFYDYEMAGKTVQFTAEPAPHDRELIEHVDEHGQIYDKRAVDATTHTPIVKYSESGE